MALYWHQEARARIAPRDLDDFKIHKGTRQPSWTWIRSSFTTLAWNDLAEPPKTATDEELAAALAACAPAYCALFLGKQFGIDRVFSVLLANKEKGLTPAIARELVLHAGSKLAACTELATAAWEAGDVVTHRVLAYGFFEDDAWREQAFAEILKYEGFSNEALALARTEDEVRTLLARTDEKSSIEYCEMAAAIEAAALPILMELAPKIRGNHPHLSHALALSVFKDRAVAQHFAAHLSHPKTRAVIGDYFQRFRGLAEDVLPAASKGASRNAALVKALLIKVCGAPAEDVELAPEDDEAIPEVLRDPPWKKELPPAPKMGIDLASYPQRVALDPGVGTEALAWMQQQRQNAPEMSDAEKTAHAETIEPQTYVAQWVVEGKAVPLDLVLRTYNRGAWARWGSMDDAMLVKFGMAALPGFLRDSGSWMRLSPAVLRGIDVPQLALPHANLVMQTATAYSRNPWIWLDAQPRAAAFGLLAAQGDPATRMTAEIVLRRLARRHLDVVLAVGDEIGHGEWVRELLGRDARLDFTIPPKVDLHHATRPRLRDGRALPDATLRNLFEMIAFSSIDEPYAGFEDVRAACDPKSVSDMSWDLAALAEGGGRRRQSRNYSEWLRWSLVHFADDEVIRRLTPALKHATIYRVLEVLATKGSRIAMMEIATAHEREDPQGATSMTRIAERAGVSTDEIVESILPTTPLSPDGHTTLEYGKRTLKVGFDTTLAPVLSLEDARLASLPRAKKNDDPIAIRLAKERWDELKEDVRTIAQLRCKALSAAIRTRRPIPAARFLSGWANHPLGKHLARGIVWGVQRGDTLDTFRVAEDSTLADLDDRTLTLADSDVVIVPHPMDLDRAVLDRWSTTFVEYGLIQPIHQLDRTPLALAPGEDALEQMDRPIAPPMGRTAFDRVLREQGFQRWTRPTTFAPGYIYVYGSTEYVARKRMVVKVRLEARDGANAKLKLGAIHPRELAEALFVVRLVLEAS